MAAGSWSCYERETAISFGICLPLLTQQATSIGILKWIEDGRYLTVGVGLLGQNVLLLLVGLYRVDHPCHRQGLGDRVQEVGVEGQSWRRGWQSGAEATAFDAARLSTR